MALGAYGLSQGLLQIPYGLVSDRVGRKPIVAGGLLLVAAGCVVAALANSICGLMIGRTLQDAGAVGLVHLALLADLTREEEQTAAMAMVGMTIGLLLAAAIVLGGAIGVSGIFWLAALFSVLGIGVVYAKVPSTARAISQVALASWRTVRRHRTDTLSDLPFQVTLEPRSPIRRQSRSISSGRASNGWA